ncbi:MAG: CPBP family intramembrane metalloprotease [Cyclobacteriaceae bacterium]|jgi:membrane protease YdiL (CAAX protease family)|nr:CPBP family intramembrane metalloprotease [Cyclobacteriaceae bacterium]
MLETDEPTRHSFLTLLLLLVGICLGFVVVGPLVGFLFAMPFYDGSVLELAEALQDPLNHPDVRIPIYILQACATLVGLIITPMVLLRVSRRRSASLFAPKDLHLTPFLLIPLIVVAFMAVNSWFVEWNAGWRFPSFLRAFEEWARANEEQRAEITSFMTTFGSPGELLIALIVIAVLPAIGEEFVFRGLFQNELKGLTNNTHVAIWLAAFLFSAFHIQFFGFVPRLLLGGLFGYLYAWSGSLLIPIFAHFVNNALAVLSLYFYQTGKTDISLESPEAAPWPLVLAGAGATAFLLMYFKGFYDRQQKTAYR